MNKQQQYRPQQNAEQQQAQITEKKRKELWLYLAVSITAVELFIFVGALLYSFINSTNNSGAPSFPWLMWTSIATLVPAIILVAVNQADVGLFRNSKQKDIDFEWQQHLPKRLQKFYTILKGAPAIVMLIGIIVLCGALLTLDGAFAALGAFAASLKPHIPFILGSLVTIIVISIGAATWLSYRNRRLYTEYEFRREIFEKTGVIIVDKGSMALPPAGNNSIGTMPYAVVGANEMKAIEELPEDARVAVATEVEARKDTLMDETVSEEHLKKEAIAEESIANDTPITGATIDTENITTEKIKPRPQVDKKLSSKSKKTTTLQPKTKAEKGVIRAPE